MQQHGKLTGLFWLACALGAVAVGAQPQSLQVDAYLQDGAKHSARFFSLRSGTIQMEVDGGVRQAYTAAQVPLLVFDDRYTQLEADRKTTEQAYPHTILLKDGRALQGTALEYYVGGSFIALIEGQRQTFNSVDVARIYFDPKSFFAKSGSEPTTTTALKRDQAFLKLANGNTSIETIEDIRGGKERYYALKGGKRIPMDDVAYINFEAAEDLTRSDRGQLQRDQATFFMRDGRVIHGRVRDMLGNQAFELEDGTRIPIREIARVYFR